MLSSFNRGSVTILPKCALCMSFATTLVSGASYIPEDGTPTIDAYLCSEHAEDCYKSMEAVRDRLRHDGEIE